MGRAGKSGVAGEFWEGEDPAKRVGRSKAAWRFASRRSPKRFWCLHIDLMMSGAFQEMRRLTGGD